MWRGEDAADAGNVLQGRRAMVVPLKGHRPRRQPPWIPRSASTVTGRLHVASYAGCEGAAQKPLRLTTGRHHAWRKAIRWIEGRKVLHRQNRYLNNRIEQSHRPIKQRYYPMLGFKRFDSASRFCTAFDELRHYLRIRPTRSEPVTSSRRRKIFATRWSTLIAELAA